mgnify:CR=1 FL=1
MTLTLPTPQNPLRIGTRGSPLAMAQAVETRARLSVAFDLPLTAFEIVVIKVTGDLIQDRPLKEIGGKGLFTREIEEDLLAGKIDIAVHSMKDMPTIQPGGLLLDTFLPREDPRDAFVAPLLSALDQLAECTFLAMAGLNRLAMENVPATPIDDTDMLPAVAQGAIGIERRAGDADTERLLAAIHDTPTGQRLTAERAFLLTLDGSCETPIAGLATLDGDTLHLRGEVLRPDGSEVIAGDRSGPIADGGQMGIDLAQDLLSQAGPHFFDWHDAK